MSGEPFRIRDVHRRRTQLLELGGAEADHRHGAQEMVHAQGGTEPGRASRGHHVTGAGDVVANDFRRVFTQEQTAGVLDLADPGPRVVQQQAKVLRSDAVHQVHGLFQGIDQHHPSLAVKRRLGDVASGLGGQHPFYLGVHLIDQFLTVGDQDRGCQRVVLRLGDEVGGAEAGVGRFVGQHDGLGGAEYAVDVHLALDQLLGIGHEDVAGAADFVYFWNGVRSVGHGRDGRHSAHLVEGVHSGYLRGDYHRRVQRFSPLGRRAEDDLADAGHPGRYSRH